jgi:tetratricopeptide (TPR) repeat protein
MNKKQIAVVGIVALMMGYLYLQPVKGLIKPKEGRSGSGQVTEAAPVANVTVDMVSAASKAAIGQNLAVKISTLEEQLKKAKGTARLPLIGQLAHQWDDVNQPAPAAFYYQELAKSQNQYTDWLTAGNRFNDAYKFTQDTTMQPAFVANAAAAFQQVLKQKPDNLDAQTGLGIADVNGAAASPMEGIGLLRGVVEKDPGNWNANLALGQFAMKSGQYDKAVTRFKTMIAQKPDPKKSILEPYFYLAESYKQLGQKPEAIAAYQKCKELMPDSTFGKRIDDFINELKH